MTYFRLTNSKVLENLLDRQFLRPAKTNVGSHSRQFVQFFQNCGPGALQVPPAVLCAAGPTAPRDDVWMSQNEFGQARNRHHAVSHTIQSIMLMLCFTSSYLDVFQDPFEAGPHILLP